MDVQPGIRANCTNCDTNSASNTQTNGAFGYIIPDNEACTIAHSNTATNDWRTDDQYVCADAGADARADVRIGGQYAVSSSHISSGEGAG